MFPTDYVSIDSSTFSDETFIEMTFSSANTSINSTNFVINNCTFSDYYSNKSAIYLIDSVPTIDDGSSLFIETKISNSVFKNSSGGSGDIITATFISNNVNSVDTPRYTIFTESNVSNIVAYTSDPLGTTNNGNITSVTFYNTEFSQLNTNYVVNPTMTGTATTVEMIDCTFEENSIRTAIIPLNFTSFNMSGGVMANQTLLIEGINPISINLNDIQLENTQSVVLNSDRSTDYPCTMNVKNSIF